MLESHLQVLVDGIQAEIELEKITKDYEQH